MIPDRVLWSRRLFRASQNPPVSIPVHEYRETLVMQFRSLVLSLEKKFSTIIEFDFSADYAEIIATFIDNTIDSPNWGPLPYVQLRAKNTRRSRWCISTRVRTNRYTPAPV